MTDILEYNSVNDVFVEELAAIENLGPCRRLIFTTRRHIEYGEGNKLHRVVVAKLILPVENLPELAQVILQGEKPLPPAPAHQGAKH
jgi:hypothetical protein